MIVSVPESIGRISSEHSLIRECASRSVHGGLPCGWTTLLRNITHLHEWSLATCSIGIMDAERIKSACRRPIPMIARNALSPAQPHLTSRSGPLPTIRPLIATIRRSRQMDLKALHASDRGTLRFEAYTGATVSWPDRRNGPGADPCRPVDVLMRVSAVMSRAGERI
jgi:hypothetical protein